MAAVAPSPVDVIALTRALVDIDSTTGLEAEAGRYLSAYLRARGLIVLEQPVDKTRFNIIASYVERPEVVLSTHFDCVPPYFPSRIENGRIHGRGSCDAKGSWRRRLPPPTASAARASRASGCSSSSARSAAPMAPSAPMAWLMGADTW